MFLLTFHAHVFTLLQLQQYREKYEEMHIRALTAELEVKQYPLSPHS